MSEIYRFVVLVVKPPPPKVWWSEQEPLGISWTSSCDQLRLSLGSCDVRHRTEAGQDWMQVSQMFLSVVALLIQ